MRACRLSIELNLRVGYPITALTAIGNQRIVRVRFKIRNCLIELFMLLVSCCLHIHSSKSEYGLTTKCASNQIIENWHIVQVSFKLYRLVLLVTISFSIESIEIMDSSPSSFSPSVVTMLPSTSRT